MRSIIFFSLLLVGTIAYADNVTTPVNNNSTTTVVDDQSPAITEDNNFTRFTTLEGNTTKTVTTFYGSKASSKANNPCKGATTRVCGKIETELARIYVEDKMAVCQLTEKLKDPDGNILQAKDEIVAIPLSDWAKPLQPTSGDDVND